MEKEKLPEGIVGILLIFTNKLRNVNKSCLVIKEYYTKQRNDYEKR